MTIKIYHTHHDQGNPQVCTELCWICPSSVPVNLPRKNWSPGPGLCPVPWTVDFCRRQQCWRLYLSSGPKRSYRWKKGIHTVGIWIINNSVMRLFVWSGHIHKTPLQIWVSSLFYFMCLLYHYYQFFIDIERENIKVFFNCFNYKSFYLDHYTVGVEGRKCSTYKKIKLPWFGSV